MKEVNLINPPCQELYDPSVYPPLGLLYIGAALKNLGYACRYIDLSEGMEEIPDADYHMITVLQSTYYTALEVRKSIKRGKIVIGGIMPTLIPETAMKDFKCTVVSGEAEQSMEMVMKSIDNDKAFIDCDVVKDLNLSLFPDRDLLSLEKLRNLSEQFVGRYDGDGAATTMMSSRGCPFRCAYCSKSPNTNYFRFRNANNVFDEMNLLRNKYGISHIGFIDDNFTVSKDSTYALCNLLKGQGFYWRCMTRADMVNKDLLTKMYNSGCRNMQFGSESGSPEVLNLMNKGITVEQNIKAIRLAEEIGISVKVLIIEDFPGETEEDKKLTMEFIEKSQPHEYAITKFVPLYGTKFEKDAKLGEGCFYDNEDSKLKMWLKSEVWRKK